jgi:hypothetical protein
LAQENGLQIPSDKWHVLCEQGDADGDKNVIGTAYTCRLLAHQQQSVREIKYFVDMGEACSTQGTGKMYSKFC